MNNRHQKANYHFIFHDYGGLNAKEPIEEDIRQSGSYRFEKKYCFVHRDSYASYKNTEEENEIIRENQAVCDEAFKVLKEIKAAISRNKESGIVLFDFQDKADKSYEDSEGMYPYSLNYINKTVKTGNYVGVIKYRTKELEATVEIGSRFDTKNPSQLFLSYLLSKAFDGQQLPEYSPDVGHQNMWELLLLFIFYRQVKEAYRQGLFKSYKTFEYNNPKVRGKIDVSRQIRINTPFVGNIAYSVREHTFDTPMLHLIRHTFERLERKYPAIMDSLNSKDKTGTTLDNIKRVLKEVTVTFNSNDVQRVMQSTKTRITHPYFNNYEPLRKTCRMILRDMGISIFDSDQNQEVYGILININWLWENFVGKEIMAKCGFAHIVGEKTPLLVSFEDVERRGNGAAKLREFDFIKSKVMVADAKYKPKWSELKWADLSNDIYQVLSYMLVSGVNKGGIVFPQKTTPDASTGIMKYHIWTDHNSDDPYAQEYYFYTIPLCIPDALLSGDIFKAEIERGINALVEKLEEEGI